MSVATMSRFFAILALLCFATVSVVALGAAIRRLGGERERFATARDDLGRVALWLAWLVATTSMLGSLYLSEIANFVPCPLCWYQRICMYPLALILGIAAVRRDRDVRVYAIPLAGIGAAIAVYHSWITAYPPSGGSAFCTVEAPCTERWVWEFGFVSIPLMALAGFLFVITMLLVATPRSAAPSSGAEVPTSTALTDPFDRTLVASREAPADTP